MLYSFVKSKGVYACPDDSTPTPVSYAYNMNFCWSGNHYNYGGPYIALSQFNAPASTVLLAEITGVTDDPSSENPTGNNSASTWGVDYLFYSQTAGGHQGGPSGTVKMDTGVMGNSPGSNSGEYNKPTGRHTDGSNFLMTDGHVKWLHGSAVSSGSVTDDRNPATTNASSSNAPTSTTGGSQDTAAGTAYPGYAATYSPI